MLNLRDVEAFFGAVVAEVRRLRDELTIAKKRIAMLERENNRIRAEMLELVIDAAERDAFTDPNNADS